MVKSHFRAEVEIWPFRACTIKNTQDNPSLWPNCRKFRALKDIGVEKHDGDVRCKTGSGNMATSCMRNASDHNYRNSSVIVDLAMGQMGTERISSIVVLYVACFGI